MKQQMEMIRHEAVGVDLDTESLMADTEQTPEVDAITVCEEDLLVVDPSVHDVEPTSVVVAALPPAHAATLNEGCRTVTKGAWHVR